MWVATTAAPCAAATRKYSGSAKPLMSLPSTAPAPYDSSATDARQVSTETGRSNRSTRPTTAGRSRSISSLSVTSGPGPALTAPTSRMSAPSATIWSARAQKASQSQVAPLSKKESGVRLSMPMTRARWAMS